MLGVAHSLPAWRRADIASSTGVCGVNTRRLGWDVIRSDTILFDDLAGVETKTRCWCCCDDDEEMRSLFMEKEEHRSKARSDMREKSNMLVIAAIQFSEAKIMFLEGL